MTDPKPKAKSSTTDQILDLLLDALTERQQARLGTSQDKPLQAPEEVRAGPTPQVPKTVAPAKVQEKPVPPPRPEPPKSEQKRAKTPTAPPAAPTKSLREPSPGEKGWTPPPHQPSINMGKMILRLALLLAVAIVLMNIPVNQYGTSLARILPETQSLIIRDGLVLKGSGPEIYILENDKLRWISSMDAFDHMGLTWGDVRVVEDEFLDRFEKGPPLHVLLKCLASPHIYRLENEQKRWIRDIETFEAEGHVWEDVRMVSCPYLRELPDGAPIPEDAGPPPQP